MNGYPLNTDAEEEPPPQHLTGVAGIESGDDETEHELLEFPPGLTEEGGGCEWRNRWNPPYSHHSHHPPHFRPHHKILRQSGYIIACITEQDFVKIGGTLLDWGLYYLQQPYDPGSTEHETVALIGIPMIHVNSFFSPSSHLIEQLRELPQLSFIMDIDELSCAHTCDVLKKFKQFFDECDSNMLLLLNIEPGGEGKYKRIYPYPRLTIPGGTMEAKDSGDFLQCALREFHEETHILLADNYELVLQKRIHREVNKRKKKKHYQIFSNSKMFDKCMKVESMYFAVRIRHF